MTADSDARALILSGAEAIAIHRVFGLIEEDFPLAGRDVVASGIRSLLNRGLIHNSGGRYEVSQDVADLLLAFDDPEWSMTWMSLRPGGPTVMAGAVGDKRAAIRAAEADGRQAFSWSDPSVVLSVVYEACDLAEHARPDGPIVVVEEQDVLDQFDTDEFDQSSATFTYAGREMVEVLSIAIECRRRGVATRSLWVKGADRSFWRYRDLDGADFGCIEPADPADLWEWLNKAEYAVRQQLVPPGTPSTDE